MAVRVYLVATRDYQAGEQVVLFNSYNKLILSTMAESYGFLDLNAAYVNIPSISKDLHESPAARGIDPCITQDMVFSGDISEGRMEARFRHLHQTTYYKPFHPGQLVYQCVRVMLQSEHGPIAKYMAEKIGQDLKAYEDMANAAHCQSSEGNFPIIGQQVNEVTARLLRDALLVAKQAARCEIDYPGMSFP
jgi:hypothetical protein